MKRNKELIDELTKIYELLEAHDINEAKRVILAKLGEYEMTPYFLAEQKEINENKRLCYSMLTAFDRDHYPEQNRLFFIAYQRLKRCISGKDALEIMQETMDQYFQRYPTNEKQYKYISVTDFNNLIDKHQKWLRFDDDGQQVRLSGYDFSGLNLKDLDLRKVIFRDCLFKDNDMSWTNFELADLCDCQFEHCKMIGTRFVRSHLQETIYDDCNLRAANFDEAELDQAQYISSDLTSAFFRDNECKINIDDSCQTRYMRVIKSEKSDLEYEM